MGTSIERATVHRQRDCACLVDNWIECSSHSRLKKRFKTPTQPVSQQWFECSAVGLTQIRLLPGNLSFPFVTLKQPSVAGGLNLLDIATSLSSHAQHQAVLAQLLLVGIGNRPRLRLIAWA